MSVVMGAGEGQEADTKEEPLLKRNTRLSFVHDPSSPYYSPKGSIHTTLYRMDKLSIRDHPDYHAEFVADRRTTLTSAVFNLVSTIIGGGVLSLPYAFMKAGIIPGILMLGMASVACDWSVYLLMSCSRRTGLQSYGAVVEKAIGPVMARVLLFCVICLTFLGCVAYAILLRDIVPPLLVFVKVLEKDPSQGTRTLVMVSSVLIVLPVTFFKSLHRLRFTSVLSIVAVLLLAIVLTYHAIAGDSAPLNAHHINLFPKSFIDILYVFPIFAVAFLCHFNVLPAHCDLIVPTRSRVKGVVHLTVGICALFYLWIGMAGYLISYQETPDNILIYFPTSDVPMALGRVGLTIALMCSVPLLVLPCREVIDEIVVGLIFYAIGTHHDRFVQNHSDKLRIIESTVIVGMCLLVAMQIESVVTVWSYMGSTAGILVAFILPPLCYLRIRQPTLQSSMTVPAWVLLVFGAFASVTCTVIAIKGD